MGVGIPTNSDKCCKPVLALGRFKLAGTAADADPQAMMDGLTLDQQASRMWILGKKG